MMEVKYSYSLSFEIGSIYTGAESDIEIMGVKCEWGQTYKIFMLQMGINLTVPYSIYTLLSPKLNPTE